MECASGENLSEGGVGGFKCAYGRFKVELIYAEKYRTVSEAKTGIFEYIELFYNRVRRHSAIGYMSPNDFEAKPN